MQEPRQQREHGHVSHRRRQLVAVVVAQQATPWPRAHRRQSLADDARRRHRRRRLHGRPRHAGRQRRVHLEHPLLESKVCRRRERPRLDAGDDLQSCDGHLRTCRLVLDGQLVEAHAGIAEARHLVAEDPRDVRLEAHEVTAREVRLLVRAAALQEAHEGRHVDGLAPGGERVEGRLLRDVARVEWAPVGALEVVARVRRRQVALEATSETTDLFESCDTVARRDLQPQLDRAEEVLLVS